MDVEIWWTRASMDTSFDGLRFMPSVDKSLYFQGRLETSWFRKC